MCDYSLHDVTSRPAKVGDELVTTEFWNTTTRGFSPLGNPRWPCAFFLARRSHSRKRSSVSLVDFICAFSKRNRGASVTRWPGSGRSTWTIHVRTMMPLNSPIARSCSSRIYA
jgi:hypothetical protein